MRKLALFIFILSCGNVFAQHFRLEPQLNSLHLSQEGTILAPIGISNPPYGYASIPVYEEGSAGGFGTTLWYSLNFGTRMYEKMCVGVQTGFVVNKSTEANSEVLPAVTHNWNLRFPVMGGVRIGTAVDPFHGTLGLGISGGVELFRTAISNETGTYLLPKIEAVVGYKQVFFGFSVYPMDIISYYEIDGVKSERMRSSIYEIHLRTAINWFPKEYRADKKPTEKKQR